MLIQKKKILFVGKETFMYPFLFLNQKWKDRFEIASLWTNPQEPTFDECDLNSSTYYECCRRGIKAYGLSNAVKKYINGTFDKDKIEKLEEKYSHFKNFNQQLISDQMMSVCYHTRAWGNPPSYEQQLWWLQCVYENIEEILDDYKPDVIFDCDIAELPRTVLNEIAYYRGIPYINQNVARYEMYKIPSYTRNLGIEKYFLTKYGDCLNEENVEEKDYVINFRNTPTIKNSTYFIKGNATYAYESEPLITTLKKIYGICMYMKRQDKSKKNRELKKLAPEIFPTSRKFLKTYIKNLLFRRYLYKTKTLFENPVENEPYVYMPLHLIPESSTFSMAPFWINELTTIEAVSKSLPAGWRLYVKEHQSMLGERSMAFYKQVKKIPNVRLVRFNYYDDPKPWIENARAVVTITGTSAYEAALLGKPAFVFGDVPFAVIKGVTRVRDIEKLPRLFQDIKDVQDTNNVKECAAYIKAVKSLGKSIDLGNIMNKAYAHLVQEKELDEEFWKELENLREFFEDAYEYAEERMR